MRIAAHCRPYADDIAFQHCPTVKAVEASDWWGFDRIYASLIFERTRPVADALLQKYRFAEVGGTGWDVAKRLEDIGIKTKQQDYGMYPHYRHSIGFTQRGCRLKCKFCVVPRKEGAVVEEQSIPDIWRKEPYPRNIVLLDNDFFGQPNWRQRIEEIRAGDFKVSFNQGINCRMITDEAAAAIASVRYYDDDFKRRRIIDRRSCIWSRRGLGRAPTSLWPDNDCHRAWMSRPASLRPPLVHTFCFAICAIRPRSRSPLAPHPLLPAGMSGRNCS